MGQTSGCCLSEAQGSDTDNEDPLEYHELTDGKAGNAGEAKDAEGATSTSPTTAVAGAKSPSLKSRGKRDSKRFGRSDRKRDSKKSERSRRKLFVDEKQFSVCILTWNVNGKAPVNDAHIDSLLRLENIADPKEQPDMFVIGLQELIDLNAKRIIKQNDKRMNKWEKKIETVLNGSDLMNKTNSNVKNNNVNNVNKTRFKNKYIKLVTTRLFGMLLLIFVSNRKKEFFSNSASGCGIANIITSKVGTGLMGKGGNKGSVSIQFRLFDFHICFVNCHLAAHQDKVQQRREDYEKIIRQTRFEKAPKSTKTSTAVDYSFDGYNSSSGLPPKTVLPEATSSQVSIASVTETKASKEYKSDDADETSVPTSNVSGISGNAGNAGNVENDGSSGNIASSPIASSDNVLAGSEHEVVNILDNDVIFVFGDLNYRLNYAMDEEVEENEESEAKNAIDENGSSSDAATDVNDATDVSDEDSDKTDKKGKSRLRRLRRKRKQKDGKERKNSKNRKDGKRKKKGSVATKDMNRDEFNKVVKLVEDGKFGELLKKDQLINEMERKNVFEGFNESKITFAPTFKYKVNTYDRFNKKRMPSYCDRILWKVEKKQERKRLKIKCVKYTSRMDCTMSDHKPVCAMFVCQY